MVVVAFILANLDKGSVVSARYGRAINQVQDFWTQDLHQVRLLRTQADQYRDCNRFDRTRNIREFGNQDD